MSGDQLIVSPLSLSFQAPISHFQKRLITMINASAEDVIFRIQINNNTNYSVIPMRGRVNAFESAELTIALSPVIKEIPECSLVVRSIPLAMIAHKEEKEWNSTEILIELDPKKALRLEDELMRMRLQADDLGKKKSQCFQIKYHSPKLWPKGFLYVLGVLSVIMTAYFGFSLMSKRIF